MKLFDSAKDVNVADLNKGDVLVADGGFDCIPEGKLCIVHEHPNGLYVDCARGKHFLEGQIDYDNIGYLVGLRMIP